MRLIILKERHILAILFLFWETERGQYDNPIAPSIHVFCRRGEGRAVAPGNGNRWRQEWLHHKSGNNFLLLSSFPLGCRMRPRPHHPPPLPISLSYWPLVDPLRQMAQRPVEDMLSMKIVSCCKNLQLNHPLRQMVQRPADSMLAMKRNPWFSWYSYGYAHMTTNLIFLVWKKQGLLSTIRCIYTIKFGNIEFCLKQNVCNKSNPL